MFHSFHTFIDWSTFVSFLVVFCLGVLLVGVVLLLWRPIIAIQLSTDDYFSIAS